MWRTIPTSAYQTKTELIRAVIKPTDHVLDVGFWGQANTADMSAWPHRIIESVTPHLWGVDLAYDPKVLTHPERYQKASAEEFSFEERFDVIIALDLIEHVPNPGRFLACAKRHLKAGGRLILTTPNAFNLFVLAGKLSRIEPPVNSDHVAYYNRPTISVLLKKCGWDIEQFGFLYTLGALHEESGKKKLLNVLYRILARFTDKYYETLVVIARPGA